MKKISIIIIVIALLCLGGGIAYTVLSSNSSKNTKKLDYVEERNYSVVQQATPNSFATAISPTNFAEVATQMGLQEASCQPVENDPTGQFCSAFYNGYQNLNYQDTIAASYKDALLNQFSMVLYFDSDDFTANKVMDVSNKLLNNFFGTSVDQKNVSDVMEELESHMDEKEPVATKEFAVGDFTEQINMQYVKDTQIYVVRYFLILTSEYTMS